VRHWLVAGALITDIDDRLLLVCNRRRDGSHDWTTPGGVIEDGEELLVGLAREVIEETGLVVHEWSGPAYTVEIEAPGLGWHLRVEAHRALRWSGTIAIDDPDAIVVDVDFFETHLCGPRVGESARWVHEPLLAWIGGDGGHHSYLAHGSDRTTLNVQRR
jgi:8-oxo-dGTP diphosphatase